MNLRPVDPWIIYRSQMRAIRNKYALETLQLESKEKEAREAEAKQRLLDQQARIKDIQEYKKSKQESILSVFPKKQVDGKKMHPIFNMTMDELKDYYANRKADRFSRALEATKKRQEYRTNALLHLYHEAKDFVTYENMEEKLEQVTSQKSTGSILNQMSIPDMISSKIKGSDLHLSQKVSKRKNALTDALHGTVADGNMGKEEITKVLREFEASGGSLLEKKKSESQKLPQQDLDSVLDRMCS